MTKVVAFVTACLAVFLATAPAFSEDLQIMTVAASPPVGGGLIEPKPVGVVTLVEALRARVGLASHIEFVPWAHAYHQALHEPNVMIFPTTRTAERETLFQWVGPLHSFHAKFFALGKSGIRIAAIDDARTLASIGVVRGSALDSELTRLGFNNIDRGKDEILVVRKLLAGRNPVIVELDTAIRRYFDENGGDRSVVVPVAPFIEVRSYLAFSLGTPRQTVDSWQHALDAMKADGSFDRLYTSSFQDD